MGEGGAETNCATNKNCINNKKKEPTFVDSFFFSVV